MGDMVLPDNKICAKSFDFFVYLLYIYALNDNMRWKKFLVSFLFILDSMEVKTRTLENSEPFYCLVILDSNITSGQNFLTAKFP